MMNPSVQIAAVVICVLYAQITSVFGDHADEIVALNRPDQPFVDSHGNPVVNPEDIAAMEAAMGEMPAPPPYKKRVPERFPIIFDNEGFPIQPLVHQGKILLDAHNPILQDYFRVMQQQHQPPPLWRQADPSQRDQSEQPQFQRREAPSPEEIRELKAAAGQAPVVPVVQMVDGAGRWVSWGNSEGSFIKKARIVVPGLTSFGWWGVAAFLGLVVFVGCVANFVSGKVPMASYRNRSSWRGLELSSDTMVDRYACLRANNSRRRSLVPSISVGLQKKVDAFC